MIESGHFRFHVVGERILHLDAPALLQASRARAARPRGAAAEGARPSPQRACAACAVTQHRRLRPGGRGGARPSGADREPRAARTLLLELERLYNHLNDIGNVCAGVGFAPGAMAFAALKDRAQRHNQSLAGHRFLFGTVAAGTGVLALDAPAVDRARGELRELRTDAAAAGASWGSPGPSRTRLDGVGVLRRRGRHHPRGRRAVGARGRGTCRRARAQPAPRLRATSRAAAPRERRRATSQRALDVRRPSSRRRATILDGLLSRPLAAGTDLGDAPTSPGRHQPGREPPRRDHVRPSSSTARTLRESACAPAPTRTGPRSHGRRAGNLLPDFPLINKSFELCYACVDR